MFLQLKVYQILEVQKKGVKDSVPWLTLDLFQVTKCYVWSPCPHQIAVGTSGR